MISEMLKEYVKDTLTDRIDFFLDDPFGCMFDGEKQPTEEDYRGHWEYLKAVAKEADLSFADIYNHVLEFRTTFEEIRLRKLMGLDERSPLV
jgi:hypothetical protein